MVRGMINTNTKQYYVLHINELISMQKVFVMSSTENNMKQFILKLRTSVSLPSFQNSNTQYD